MPEQYSNQNTPDQYGDSTGVDANQLDNTVTDTGPDQPIGAGDYASRSANNNVGMEADTDQFTAAGTVDRSSTGTSEDTNRYTTTDAGAGTNATTGDYTTNSAWGTGINPGTSSTTRSA